jgi:hypothetical protein
MLKSTLAVCVAAAVFLPLASWLCTLCPVPSAARAQAADLFVNPAECRPEPGERLAFMVGLAVVPGTILFLSYVLHRCRWRIISDVENSWLFALVFGSLFLIFCWYCLLEQQYFHVRHSIFWTHPVLALPLLGCTLLAFRLPWDKPRPAQAVHLLALALVTLVSLACVFDEGGEYARDWHFSAVFNSVVQVHFDRALLIDCRGQYGLYAHFLQPVFDVTGLSVLTCTIAMAVLLAVSYVAVWGAIRENTSHPLVTLTGFFALVFTSWFYLRFSDNGRFQWVDPYFQYHPIRFLFPTMLVILAGRYYRRPSTKLYWATTGLLSAGVLWNFDSGLPSLMAWLGGLCFAELFDGGWRKKATRVLQHLAAVGSTLAAVVTLFSLAIYARYGAPPDFSEFFRYQKLFYISGFFMLPIEVPGMWVLVVLTYLGGFAYAAGALARKDDPGSDTARAKLVFLLSLLGLGLFSYYQGRSHHYVLTLVWWPCFVLLTLFLDGLVTAWRYRPRFGMQAVFLLAIAWLLSGYAWSAVRDLECMGNLISEQFPRPDSARALEFRREAELLRSYAGAENEMLILAPWDPTLHLLSGIPSLAPSSFIEMVLVADYRDVMRRLEDRPSAKVYIDKDMLSWNWRRLGSRQLIDEIQKTYELCAETPAGYVYQRGNMLLQSPEAAICHLGFQQGRYPAGMETSAIKLPADFSLELIINPDPVPRPWRVILSNHCGSPEHQGMMLFETHPNLYEFVCGTGEDWRHCVRVKIPPGRWNYLALTWAGGRIRAYHDGELVDEHVADGWTLKRSVTPLIIGDWLNKDCPFHGRIKEVRILPRALAESEITANAARVRQELP